MKNEELLREIAFLLEHTDNVGYYIYAAEKVCILLKDEKTASEIYEKAIRLCSVWERPEDLKGFDRPECIIFDIKELCTSMFVHLSDHNKALNYFKQNIPKAYQRNKPLINSVRRYLKSEECGKLPLNKLHNFKKSIVEPLFALIPDYLFRFLPVAEFYAVRMKDRKQALKTYIKLENGSKKKWQLKRILKSWKKNKM